MRAADLRGNRADFWYVRIIDVTLQDVRFEFDWRACYGHPWPKVAPGIVHPCLARLYDRYATFDEEWRAHCQEREDTTYALQDDSEDDMSDGGERRRYERVSRLADTTGSLQRLSEKMPPLCAC